LFTCSFCDSLSVGNCWTAADTKKCKSAGNAIEIRKGKSGAISEGLEEGSGEIDVVILQLFWSFRVQPGDLCDFVHLIE
jgi:hypothetical protein